LVNAPSRQRAFSLIEAAIVLGVIGLIIGGLWVAASVVRKHLQTNELIAGYFTAAQNIQRVVSASAANAYWVAGGSPGGGVNFTDAFLIGAGIFPANWIRNGAISSPFGAVYVAVYPVLSFRFSGLPRSACIAFLTQVSTFAAQTGSSGAGGWARLGLGHIQVNFPTWQTSSFPISAEQATTACSFEAGNVIYTYQGFSQAN